VPAEQVVLYDKSGVFSAPRVWWTFRAFGHERQAATLKLQSVLRRHGVFSWIGHKVPQHADVHMLVSSLNHGCCCRVAVLDGGFPAWAADKLPVDTSQVTDDQMSAPAKAAAAPSTASHYRATLNVSKGRLNPRCALVQFPCITSASQGLHLRLKR
jgi:thiosulfate/3-mercaptopyruvate sulfurtransferase